MRVVWPRGLRARLVLLVLLVVLPVFALIVIAGWEQRQAAARDAQRQALELARSVSDEMEDAIRMGEGLLAVLANIPEVRTLDTSKCSAMLAGLGSRFPAFTNIAAAGADGELRCSGQPLPGPISVANRPTFRRSMDTAAFAVGDYTVGRVTGRPVLSLSYPMLDELGRPVGAVMAGIDLEYLNRRVPPADLPAGATFTLLDGAGNVLVRVPPSPGLVGKPVPEAALLELIKVRDVGVAEGGSADGARMLYGYSRLTVRNGHAAALVGIPAALAYAPANRALARNVALLALAAALALAVGWLGSARLVLRPVRDLLAATRALAAGDRGARVGAAGGGGSELDELAVSFDDMVIRLERDERQLEALARVNQMVSRSLDLDAVLHAIAHAAAELVGARFVAFWVADPEARELRLAATSDAEMGLRMNVRTLPFGDGAVGWIARRREPLEVPDVLTDDRMRGQEWARANHLRSYLGLPIETDGELLAVLSLHHPEPLPLTAGDRRLITTFAEQAAVAFLNARLFARTERRRVEAEAIAAMAHLLGRTLELERVAQQIAEAARKLFDAEIAGVYLAEPPSGDFRALGMSVAGEPVPWARLLPRGAGALGLAIAERRQVATRDILTDQAIAVTPEVRERLEHTPSRAMLVTPIGDGDEVLGGVVIGDRVGRRFSADEMQLAETVGAHASVALRTATLFAAERRARGDAEAAQERSRRLFEQHVAAAFRAAPDGRLLEANPALVALLGFASAADAVARDPEALYADPDQRAVLADLMASEGGYASREVRWRRADGSEIWVLLSARRVEGPAGICEGIAIDVTDRRRAENAEREAGALRAVSQLALTAAHEINNPLLVVLGNLELLASDSGVRLDSTRMGRIRAAAERIADIVARMQRITRLSIAEVLPGTPSRLDLPRAGDAPQADPKPDPGSDPQTGGSATR